MDTKTSYRVRLRPKGQVTIPIEVRKLLKADEGDDLAIIVTDDGHVVVECLQIISPEQAWFWTERWQQMEREAQADIRAGRVEYFDDVEVAIRRLNESADSVDAED